HWGPTIDKELHRVIWYGTTGDPHGDMLDWSLSKISVTDVLREMEALPLCHAELVEAPP
ncbi:MAG: glycosyltransferase family 9 protein, partial [Candidatus Eremiobacteraeota bacterium]|nr:glycosyltransferase family 9 protein [Candidatus Eremiobacteraeota bacterium]